MIRFKHEGNFKNIEKFLKESQSINLKSILDRYGREGVAALASATPVDSGLTANSWSYEIRQNGSSISIYWKNSNIVDGVPIAVILQYGHGTKNGGYVRGVDYINPAMKPIFDKLADNAWKEVAKI